MTKVKNSTSKTKKSLTEINEEICKLAYQFYLDRGSQSGQEQEDWLRAERIVKAKYNID